MKKTDLITTKEAARRLRVSQRRVQAMITAGMLPAQKINSRLSLIDPRDVASLKRRKAGRPEK